MKSSLLLQETPLIILPTLATAIGLNEAIVTQQLFFLLSCEKNGQVLKDGERYIFNSYEQWREYFPFWSESTIKRIFLTLEEQSLVVSCQPDGAATRRKYYRLNHGALEHLTYHRVAEHQTKTSGHQVKLTSSSGQVGPINGPSWSLLCTESTTETTQPALIEVSSPEEIYAEYPKKVGKQEALKVIARVLRTTPHLKLIASVRLYAEAVSKWSDSDKQYIPYPATWFNKGHYDDDPMIWSRTRVPTNGNFENREPVAASNLR